jgi:phosphotransferase system enzyme I (PtsI)
MKQLKGIGASSGIAVNEAYILRDPIFTIDNRTITNTDEEFLKYQNALKASTEQLTKIKKIVLQKLDEEKAAIFDAHILLIQDPEIQKEVEDIIKNNKLNAPYVVQQIYDRYREVFAKMTDVYFKERAADIVDVKKRILSNLLNIQMPDIIGINREVIIVSHDLAPSQTALLDKKFIKGFITEIGGKTSHAAIMARSMEIPAILGTKDILSNVKDHVMIGMDGSSGEIEIQPDISV